MNERIKELAKQAGYTPLSPPTFGDELQEIWMQKFAKLVAAEEREACIAIMESFEATGKTYVTDDVKKAIRARGKV